MNPFNLYTRGFLREEAPADGGDKGGAKGAPPSDKVKIGDKEYDPKKAASAVSLYEALQDEETGTEIITALARRAGLLDKDDKPKGVKSGDTKVQESRFSKKLLSKLGKDYQAFAEAVGPVFDEAVSEFLEERIGSVENNSKQERWETAVDSFIGDHEMTTEIEDQMKEIMADAPPNIGLKTFKADRYLTRIYKQACEELDMDVPTPRKAKGTSGNPRAKRRDSEDDGIQFNDDGVPEIVIREAPKSISVDDAVNAAMNGIRFKRRS